MFTIEEHQGIHVLRDDLLLGGTKSRFIQQLLAPVTADEIIYPANGYGIAMVAIADALKNTKKKAIFIIMDNKEATDSNPIIRQAMSLNQDIIFHKVQTEHYMDVIAAADTYTKASKNRFMIPPGFNAETVLSGISMLCHKIIDVYGVFDAAFSVYGSGTVQRGMQRGHLSRSYYAVNTLYADQTARDVGDATIIQHYLKEPLNQNAALLPPFPTFPAYDAKAWVYAKNYLRINPTHKVLFWNVARMPE